MKCPYNDCRLGGEVAKEDAIYHKRRYYHKECYEKKIKKQESRNLLNDNFNFTGRNVTNAIKQLVDDKQHDVRKVLFAIKYIINNDKELNSPYGISYYMDDYRVNKQFKKHLESIKLNEIKEDITEIEVEKETKINKNNKRRKPKWMKIL